MPPSDLSELVTEIQRLRVADDEVLVVRPKGLLTNEGLEVLRRNLGEVAHQLGWGSHRIVVLDRDVSLEVVKADQLELGGGS